MNSQATPLNWRQTAREIAASPCASYWLKDTIASALQRDPIDVYQDVFILLRVIRARANESLNP